MHTSNFYINKEPILSSALTTQDRSHKSSSGYRTLRDDEISQLISQGCSASDWILVSVAPGCDLSRIHHVSFYGEVRLGSFCSEIELPGGIRQLTGIWNANLQDCIVGNEVLIRNVRQGISRYLIKDNAIICDIGRLVVDGKTAFGNGEEIHVLIEDGTFPIAIHDYLSSNITSLLTSTFEGDIVRDKLEELVQDYVKESESNYGVIGEGVTILGCDDLCNLRVGPAAKLQGASRISNVSINSTQDSPVNIGSGVIIESSIVSSDSLVDSGSNLTRCFVGQGVQIEKHFSGTDSIFFANCEMLHGETCSFLAGPFSVSHHKSTLLIAAQSSFYNAGAGTNECNHSYKTGPLHYGVMERGCKTGGGTQLVWPINLGAFSTILGSHRGRFDSTDFPFSYIVEDADETRVIPALNLIKVGLWRDQKKWPSRDRRSKQNRIDFLHYESLSPWTIERMIVSRELLRKLITENKDNLWIKMSGIKIKIKDAHRAVKIYDSVIRYYLSEQIVNRIESACDYIKSLRCAKHSPYTNSHSWNDLGGCFVTMGRLEELFNELTSGEINNLSSLHDYMNHIWLSYESDESNWAVLTWCKENNIKLSDITNDDLKNAIIEWKRQGEFIIQLLIRDSLEDITLAEKWDMDRRKFKLQGSKHRHSDTRLKIVYALQAEIDSIESRTGSLLSMINIT